MVVHDLRGIVDILDGVLSLVLFEDIGGWNSLAGRELGHRMGLDEVVMRGAARHDDARGYAGLVLSHAFQDTLSLFRRRCTVQPGRRAEHNNGIEVG